MVLVLERTRLTSRLRVVVNLTARTAIVLSLPLLASAFPLVASAAPKTVAGIDTYAAPFDAAAKDHRSTSVYANFAGDGEHYVKYDSEAALAKALRAFLDGTAPGGGNYIARVYHVPGSKGTYVTFDPGVQGSLTERESVMFDGKGRAVRLHEEETSYNGHYQIVRDAYFADGKAIADKTVRYDYAPNDDALKTVVKTHPAVMDESTMTIPVYETRAELPFSA